MWYCKVWAEWDGAEANKEPIAKKKERANNLRIEADTLQQFLEKNQVFFFVFLFVSLYFSLCVCNDSFFFSFSLSLLLSILHNFDHF